jgi:DNA-binding MarR family transcriptional regulator
MQAQNAGMPKRTKTASTGPGSPLELTMAILNTTRTLFHRAARAAEELHGEGEHSGGLRGVLMSLAAQGPRTVPQLANERPVSRQHIQKLVNTLLDAGLVETVPNPKHKRSVLVALTRAGRHRVESMRARETIALDRIASGLGRREAETTLRVLRALVESFSGAEWKEDVARATRSSRTPRSGRPR